MILGTAAYMSPEQARGKAVDKRADIWSFGVVLFEMLSGKRLFAGETVSDTLAAVLKEEVPWSTLPPNTPRGALRLLRRCLTRDPRQRLRDIGEARVELSAGDGPGPEPQAAPTPAAPPPLWRRALPLAAGAALLLALWNLRPAPPSSPIGPTRSTIDLPPGLDLGRRDRAIAFSPDGSQLALVLLDAVSSRSGIYLRDINRLDMRALDGTGGATYPFWSPDGRSIGFFANDELRRFDLPDGPARTIGPARSGRGASWGANDVIVFSAASDEGRAARLYRVSAMSPGPPEPLEANSPKDGDWARLPSFLPGDSGLLFVRQERTRTSNELDLLEPGATVSKRIGDIPSEVAYVAPGYLGFVRDDLVMVQRFDLEKKQLLGTAEVMADRAHWDSLRSTGHVAFTASAFVYQRIAPDPPRQLRWYDIEGRPLGAIGEPEPIAGISASPDGARAMAAVWTPGGFQLWLIDLLGGGRSPFTRPGGSLGRSGAWSPDGRRMAYSDELGQLMVRSTDLSTPAEMLRGEVAGNWGPTAWSADGSSIFATWTRGLKGSDLALVPARGHDGEAKVLLDSNADEGQGKLSPGGNLLAFGSVDSGRRQLYVTDYPGMTQRVAVADATLSGLNLHQWIGPTDLLFWDSEERVHILSLKIGPRGIEVASRRLGFGGNPTPGPATFVPARRQFLFAEPIKGSDSRNPLVLVTNWQAGLALRQSTRSPAR